MNLEIPKSVQQDPNSAEIARIWLSHGKQIVSINPSAWSDPAAWGLMLADFARHVANAYEQLDGRNRQVVLNRIRQGMDAEWNFPTDVPTGSVC